MLGFKVQFTLRLQDLRPVGLIVIIDRFIYTRKFIEPAFQLSGYYVYVRLELIVELCPIQDFRLNI